MIALLLAVAVVQAPGVIRGRVVDAESALPVVEAVVSGGGAVAITDAAGRFTLTGLPAGEVLVSVRRLGYAPRGVSVAVTPGAPVDLEVVLEAVPVPLEGVTARGVSSGARMVMSGEEARARGASLADALDGWQGVSVVRRTPGSQAAPVVRGSAPHEVLVLVDGVVLNDPWSGIADLSRLGTRELEEVTLVPGAQSAGYGERALAGAIVVATRAQPGAGGTAWAGSYGAAGAWGGVGLTAGAWRVGTSLGWERTADGYTVSLPPSRGGGEAVRENAGATVTRWSARLEGPVAVSLRGHYAGRGLPGTLTNPSLSGVAKEQWITATVWGGPATVSLDLLRSEASDPSPPVGMPYRSDVRAVGLQGDFRPDIGGFDLALGGRGDLLSGEGVGGSNHLAARAHGGIMRRLTTRSGGWEITLMPTVRLDVWNRRGSPALSVRADASAARGPFLLELGAGTGASHPVLADHLFHESVGVRPNPDLRPERVAWELEAGAEWRADGRMARARAGARAFLGQVEDLVLWSPDFRFIWGPENFDVRRAGADFHGRLELPSSRLATDASFSLATVRYDRPGGPQVIYRPTRVGSVQVSWAPGAWRLVLRGRHLGVRYPNHGGVNALAPTTVWDFSAGRVFRLGRLDAELAADLRDLTDRRLEFIAGQPLAGRTLSLRLGLNRP